MTVWIPVLTTAVAGSVAGWCTLDLASRPGLISGCGAVVFGGLAVLAGVQAVGMVLTERGRMDLSQWAPWRWL